MAKVAEMVKVVGNVKNCGKWQKLREMVKVAENGKKLRKMEKVALPQLYCALAYRPFLAVLTLPYLSSSKYLFYQTCKV